MSKDWWSRLTAEEREERNRKKSEQYWAARERYGMKNERGNKAETLCWSCQRAVKECPWSANFGPVDGWDAVETKVMGPYGIIPSYFVRACPMYDPDPPQPKPTRGRKLKQ